MYGRARDEMTRSKVSLANGSDSPAPCRYVRCGNLSLATATRLSSISSPVTSSEALTPQGIKSRPDPQPKSRTRITSCLQTNDGSFGDPSERNSTLVEKVGGANSCEQLTAITHRKRNRAIATERLRYTTRAAARTLELMINCLRNRNGMWGPVPKGIAFLRHSLHPVMERFRVPRKPADESNYPQCISFGRFLSGCDFQRHLGKVAAPEPPPHLDDRRRIGPNCCRTQRTTSGRSEQSH